MTARASNRVVLITGAAQNLGAATARAFAHTGSDVIVHYRTSAAAAAAVLRSIKKTAPRSSGFQADLTNEQDVAALGKHVADTYGRLDVLVNNVGDFLYKPLIRTSGDEFLSVFENNVITAHRVIRALRSILAPGSSIINLGGVGADQLITPERTTPYYIAKTGIIMLTRAYARQFASKQIRVNAISPGILESSVIKGRRTPLGRYASFQDITNAMLWLADDAQMYVTGANIEVSGAWRPEK